MKLLALDASTKATGYAIFEDNKLIESGVWKASSPDLIKRIYKITKELDSCLNQNDIDKIVCEEVRPELNGKTLNTYRALMYLQASFIFLLHSKYSYIDKDFVYPSSWRSKCGIHTGRGVTRDVLKKADIEFAEKQYGLSGLTDDEADAIGIGHAYINYTKEDFDWC